MTEPVIEASTVAPPPAGAAERAGGPVAIALLGVGLALAAAAQYLPWASVDLKAVGGNDADIIAQRGLPSRIDVDLASLNSAPVVVYLGTLTLALVGIAIMLATRGPVRRGAAAGALAMLAGNALVLVGFKHVVDRLGSHPFLSYGLTADAVHIGAGYPLAAVAVAVLAAGTIVAVRGLSRRRRPVDDFHDGTEPLELTVTPLR